MTNGNELIESKKTVTKPNLREAFISMEALLKSKCFDAGGMYIKEGIYTLVAASTALDQLYILRSNLDRLGIFQQELDSES